MKNVQIVLNKGMVLRAGDFTVLAEEGQGDLELVEPVTVETPVSAPAVSAKPMPWDEGNDRVIVGLALRMKEPMHMKLKWAAKQEQMSMHEFVSRAVESHIEAALREHLG